MIRIPFPKMAHARGINKLAYGFNEFTLQRKIIQYGPEIDLFHSHFSFSGWPYRQAILSTGKPWVISFYGFDYRALPFHENFWKERYAWLFQNADGFIVEGPHGKEELCLMGCQTQKIFEIPLGAPFNHQAFPRRRKAMKFVQISGLSEKKGIPILLDAFALAGKKNPDIHLHLVCQGSPTDMENLKMSISNHPCAERIQLTPGIEPQALTQVLLQSDILVQASRYGEDGDHEGGSPYIINQALALGIPVISTLHADIPYHIQNQKNGWLCVENNSMELALCMDMAAQIEEDAYFRMSEQALNDAKIHDAKAAAEKLTSVYTLLCSQ